MAENEVALDAEATVTLATLKENAEVAAYLAEADRVLAVLGFTEHGAKHAAMVADRARGVILALGYKERRAELAAIAGHLHDIGNVVNRHNHEAISAVLAHDILRYQVFTISQLQRVPLAPIFQLLEPFHMSSRFHFLN